MPDKTNAANRQAAAGDGTVAPPVVPVAPASPTQNPTPQKDLKPVLPATPAAATLTQEQVAEQLTKAREDEKAKVFSKLEAEKAKTAELEELAKALEDKLSAKQKDLDGVREGKMSELASVNKELEETKAAVAQMNVAIEAMGDIAAERVAESELKAYRAEKIRASGVKLADHIVGTTPDEIDASIAAELGRENALRDELREELRKESEGRLPAPMSPDGSLGNGSPERLGPAKRQAAAKLPPAEYAKVRDQLMAEANKRTGAG